jgi:hypothetical protein
MKPFVIFVLAGLAAAAQPSQGATRSYFMPEMDGNRIDLCLSGQRDCGKPAADAFCAANGFRESILFQRETAAVLSTYRLGTSSFCDGGTCTAFRQIKCYSPAATAENGG